MNKYREREYEFKRRAIKYYSTCIKCRKCEHSIQVKDNKAYCQYCGVYTYKDKKDEFNNKLKEMNKIWI